MRLLKTILLIIIAFGTLQLINAQEFKYSIPVSNENDWEVASIYDCEVNVDSLFVLSVLILLQN